MRVLLVAILLGACAAPSGPRAPSALPGSGAAGAAPFVPGGAPLRASPNALAQPAGPAGVPPVPTPSSAGAAAVAPGPPERHGPPLPELSVKSFGLHIGGSATDAAARDAFLRVLEAASARYLDCYRLIEQPGSVGTFGADLSVGAGGGKPKVGKPRTKLRGDAFHACMLHTFENISFPEPPSGRAVVVSYSVKFNLN